MVSVMTPHLQESDPAIREAVANVLGAIGDASSVPTLEAAAKDADASVAAAAKRALARIHAS
jgi:HEAT repeat protein